MGRIRARLMDHFHGCLDPLTRRATHYGWEMCTDAVAREAELLAEHERLSAGRRASTQLPD